MIANVTDNEQIIIKRAFDEFLKVACQMAQGDIDKSIKISNIWQDLKICAITEQEYAPKIVGLLKSHNFIKSGEKTDEVKVTYDGIYYVIDTFNVPAENLGVLPYEELNKYLNPFLDVLYQETNGDTTKSLSIYDIQKKRLNALGQGPIKQIAEFLQLKGLIEAGKKKDTVKLPSRYIKKSYEAPSSY